MSAEVLQMPHTPVCGGEGGQNHAHLLEQEACDGSMRSASPCGSVRIRRPMDASSTKESISTADDNEYQSAIPSTTFLEDPASRTALMLAPLRPGPVSTGRLEEPGPRTPSPTIRRVPVNSERYSACNHMSERWQSAQAPAPALENTLVSRMVGLELTTQPPDEAAQTDTEDATAASAGPGLKERKPKRPFRRWVRRFSLRRAERIRTARMGATSFKRPPPLSSSPRKADRSSYQSPRRSSTSVSSLNYVTGVRDASISMYMESSIAPSSRRMTLRSSMRFSRTDRSSRFSHSAMNSEAAGRTEDGPEDTRPTSQDEAGIKHRSDERAQTLTELITTEEGYIGDMKFLMNAYITVCTKSPSEDNGLRLSMYSSLTDIVELHDQILGELYRIVPAAKLSNLSQPRPRPSTAGTQNSLSTSLEPVSETEVQGPKVADGGALMGAPEIAAKIASVFVQKIDRFFIYEDYKIKYDMVLADLQDTYRTIPNWEYHQKGLETLASCLSYSREWQGRALTFADLFVKPVQRACKYPLLFNKLLQVTPVIDCPHSHAAIVDALARIEEVAEAMNATAANPLVKSHLEKTWLLQERLVFPPLAGNSASKSQVRSFGRVHLCGPLHICWQTETSIKGTYMICLLYQNWVCLATADKAGKSYELQACIPTRSCNIEATNNGKGLQCPAVPHSWKLAFMANGLLHEVLMTASTPTEEKEWRSQLHESSLKYSSAQDDRSVFSYLGLDIKSIALVLTPPGDSHQLGAGRKIETVPIKPETTKVILKKDGSDMDVISTLERRLSVGRAQSVRKTSRTPVISPLRGDRWRLESLISDVWTRDALTSSDHAPTHKSERSLRPTAAAVMRRISGPSIGETLSGTFTRHSLSRAHRAAAGRMTDSIATEAGVTRESLHIPRRHSDHRRHFSFGNGSTRHRAHAEEILPVGISAIDFAEAAMAQQQSHEKSSSRTTPSARSSGGSDDYGYQLTPGREGRPQISVRRGNSVFRRSTSESRLARTPRNHLGSHFVESIDDDDAVPKTASLMISSGTLRAMVTRARSKSNSEGSSKKLAAVSDDILAASPAHKLMAPLTRQRGRTGDDQADAEHEAVSKSWLKRQRNKLRRS